MTAQPTHTAPPLQLRVFLASPGDVADERALALKALERLPYDAFLRGRVVVEVVAWDKPGSDTPMLASMTPQEAIALQRPKPSECDIVVVIFWSRMGTPLPFEEYKKPDGSVYLSGTEWEYLDALHASRHEGGPKVLVYRRTEVPSIKINDPQRREKEEQWQLVEDFFQSFRNPDGSLRGGVNEYDTPDTFEKRLTEHLREVVQSLLSEHEAKNPPLVEISTETTLVPESTKKLELWKGSPFPGLRAFDEEDAPIYFGRGRETDGLVHRLADGSRFITVVGASGSGKSSLVAAGLLPRLADNAIPGSSDWQRIRFTPGRLGENPFIALAAGFEPVLNRHGRQVRDAAQKLERNPEALDELMKLMLEERPKWSELLLFVDQFEELFTVVDARYCGPFSELLAHAAGLPRLRTVATLRSDFYHRCVEQLALAELLRAGSYPLAAPGVGALHEMITRPAARAGLEFQDELPKRILDDTGAGPGALPLMAFALEQLYDQRSAGGGLTHDAYDTFKGVKGAISQRAEDTFGDLDGDAQAVLESVFRELVEVDSTDEGWVVTRRRMPLQEVAPTPAAQRLVTAFTKARLLVQSGGEEDDTPVVEVAHEALLRSWPRLATWIREAADDLRLRRQITQLADYWDKHDRMDEHRWPDDRVVEAVVMLAHLGLKAEDLPALERNFLGPLDRERMLEELDDPAIPHERRAIIGVRLSLLGDPRPGVGLRADKLPDIAWCEVPGGDVTLAVEEHRGIFRRLFHAERKFHVEPFFIAKHPVTYVQYQAFLDAEDGFYNPAWWEGLWFKVEKPGRQLNRCGNHPAETLCWLEAVAFCRWLSAKLGYEIQLPTEWEWQQAATGGDPDREYPWPGGWDSSRANTDESELGRSTAVGVYPHGASPVGALDIAGNVYELCRNEYDNPGRIDLAGDTRRVVRGGSWNSNQAHARADYRNLIHPVNRNNYVGFRLSCLAPIF